MRIFTSCKTFSPKLKIKINLIGLILLLMSCGTTERLSSRVKQEYLSKHSINSNSSSFKYRTKSLKQMLDIFQMQNEIKDTLIIIESYPDIQIPKSVTATIKSKTDSIYFISDYENNKLIRTYAPQKDGDLIHDIFYDMVMDYIKKGEISNLKTLHEKNREYNHSSTSYLTILKPKDKDFEIIKTLIFEEFAVDFKDSKDPKIRELINEK